MIAFMPEYKKIISEWAETDGFKYVMTSDGTTYRKPINCISNWQKYDEMLGVYNLNK